MLWPTSAMGSHCPVSLWIVRTPSKSTNPAGVRANLHPADVASESQCILISRASCGQGGARILTVAPELWQLYSVRPFRLRFELPSASRDNKSMGQVVDGSDTGKIHVAEQQHVTLVVVRMPKPVISPIGWSMECCPALRSGHGIASKDPNQQQHRRGHALTEDDFSSATESGGGRS